MKKENIFNKKRLIISLSVVLALFIIYGVYLFINEYVKEGNIEVNSKMEIVKKYDGLVVDDIQFIKRKGNIYLEFKIKNNTDYKYRKKTAKIVFLNKKGEVIKKENLTIPDIDSHTFKEIKTIIESKELKAYNFLISDE